MSADACGSCTGSCCRDVLVGITGFDALRIARANALPLDAFVTVATADAGSPGAFRLGDGFAALMLRRSALDDRSCTFLTGSADERRLCATHPSRPYVCRIYPMTLAHGRVELRRDVACGAGAWDLDALDYPAWERDFATYALEWEGYARAIAAWDASGLDGLPAYFAFLERACAVGDARETEHDH